MEKFLATIDPTAELDEVEMDPEELTFLIPSSKFGILLKFHRTSSRASRLMINQVLCKKYYVEMLASYTEGKYFVVVFWQFFGFVLTKTWLKFSFVCEKF